MVWQFAHVCYRKGRMTVMKGKSLEFSKDADMNILSPIFWVRCKLSRSMRPDHICHWAVQCGRSNCTTFKNFNDILAVLKLHWPYVMEILEGGEGLFRNYMYFFLLFKKNKNKKKHHMSLSRTFYWLAARLETVFRN